MLEAVIPVWILANEATGGAHALVRSIAAIVVAPLEAAPRAVIGARGAGAPTSSAS